MWTQPSCGGGGVGGSTHRRSRDGLLQAPTGNLSRFNGGVTGSRDWFSPMPVKWLSRT